MGKTFKDQEKFKRKQQGDYVEETKPQPKYRKPSNKKPKLKDVLNNEDFVFGL